MPPPIVGARAHLQHDPTGGLPGEEPEQLRARELLAQHRLTARSSAPCSWKYLFEMSMPMMLTTLSMDPPSRVPNAPCVRSPHPAHDGARCVHSIAMLKCAVERRVFLVGANPTQRLSLPLVAARAIHGGNDMG